MKVREFFANLENKDEILKKIRAFKDAKRKEEFLQRFEHCDHCGQALQFAHSSYYMQNVIDESIHCPKCGQRAPDRRYMLN